MSRVYTAGPWRVGDAGNTIFGPPNGRPSPQTICNLSIVDHVANGRLIAAAPDLLAALQTLMNGVSPDLDTRDCDELRGIARAAIAKAVQS